MDKGRLKDALPFYVNVMDKLPFQVINTSIQKYQAASFDEEIVLLEFCFLLYITVAMLVAT